MNTSTKYKPLKSNPTKEARLKACFTKESRLKAPFGWVGGKSKLAKEIASLMPKHKTYVEVFGGALSVFYAKTPSKREIVNDINSELINLHKIIRSRPASLASCLNNMIKSREIFDDIRHDKLKPRNKIEAAAFYFYRIALSFGAKGESYAKARSAGGVYREFSLHARRLKRASIENLDFKTLIARYDTPDTLFYLDPPYVGTENYYKNTDGFGLAEHKRLAEILSGIKGKFILSYNDCELVRELYEGFKIKELKTNYSLNALSKNRDKTELLIMNF